MNQSLIAVRYAKALFKLAKEKNLIDHIYQDLTLISNALKENADFKFFIESPVQKASQKREVINTVFKGKIQEPSLSFLFLVIEKSRIELIQQIIRNYSDFYRQEKNIKNITFISATKVEESFYHSLTTLLEDSLKSSVELTIKEDPDLIGGFVLNVDGKLMDASISNKLNKLKKQLLN